MFTPKKEKQFDLRLLNKENDTIWFKIIKIKNERKKNSLIWDYWRRKMINLIQDYKDDPKERKTVWVLNTRRLHYEDMFKNERKKNSLIWDYEH